MVYEFTNTRNQSLKDSLRYWDPNTGTWRTNEVDNYYNHGIYRSGFTYQKQVMSSPVFFPLNIQDDISMGIRSNRFLSHHLGVKGNLTQHLSWKGMLSYVQHLGTYGKPYDPKQNQLSGILDFGYLNPDFPVDLSFSLAADINDVEGNNLGFQFTVSKSC